MFSLFSNQITCYTNFTDEFRLNRNPSEKELSSLVIPNLSGTILSAYPVIKTRFFPKGVRGLRLYLGENKELVWQKPRRKRGGFSFIGIGTRDVSSLIKFGDSYKLILEGSCYYNKVDERIIQDIQVGMIITYSDTSSSKVKGENDE